MNTFQIIKEKQKSR